MDDPPVMMTEVTPERLKRSVGHRIKIVAFDLTYEGKLEKIDLQAGTVRIVDQGDVAVIEIERIESFEDLDH